VHLRKKKAGIRLFKTVVAMKDEFYNRHLVKYNLFDPIVSLFLANGPRYNLINSAILELFDFIRKENLKSLISHLIEKYGKELSQIKYVETMDLLILQYEKNRDFLTNSTSTPSRFKKEKEICFFSFLIIFIIIFLFFFLSFI
jgi:protein phosphatase-4 regulatory subunit 3